MADGQRHALGDVELAPVGGAERHRSRRVEHHPRRQCPLADVDANVRLAHAGGDVPVDVADVVARVVGADHRQLGAGADLRRQVLAGHEALHASQDREVERAQDRGRDRAGAGALGRALDGRELPHGSRPPRAIATTMPANSSARPAPANACRDLLLLLLGREARAEVAVDLGESLGVGRLVEAPARGARDLLQRPGVGRDRSTRDAAVLLVVLEVAALRPERDGVDGDPQLACALGDGDRVLADASSRRRRAARSRPGAAAAARCRDRSPACARRRSPGRAHHPSRSCRRTSASSRRP